MAYDLTLTALYIGFDTVTSTTLGRDEISSRLLELDTQGAYASYPDLFITVAHKCRRLLDTMPKSSARDILLQALACNYTTPCLQQLVKTRDTYIQRLDAYISNTRREDFSQPAIYDELLCERDLASALFPENRVRIEEHEFEQLMDAVERADAWRASKAGGKTAIPVESPFVE